MQVYACGQCGGALESSGQEKTVVCLYCGYTNDLGTLVEDLEDFKREVSSWLSNLGAIGGSGMDVGMRSIYFRDSIYPSLCTEFSNVVGDTEDVLDLPLFYLKVYNMIPDLRVSATWTSEQGKPLKQFSRKLESPELRSFAPDDTSQRQLNELRLSSVMMPMLMDTIELASSPSAESFTRCANTLAHLSEETGEMCCKDSSSEETRSYNTYFEILSKRFSTSSRAFSVFAEAISEQNPIGEEWLGETTGVLDEMRSKLQGLSDISVTDHVLLGCGLENDKNAIRAGYDLVNLHSNIAKVGFDTFVEATTDFARMTLFLVPDGRTADLSWFASRIDSEKFSWFLSTLRTNIMRDFYTIMAPQDLIDPWISRQPSGTTFYLYPFYLSKVTAILKSGFLLWKKGEEDCFFSLCDGAFNLFGGFPYGDYPELMTPGFKKMIGSTEEELIKSLKDSDGGEKPEAWTALPPTVNASDVRAVYSAAHNFLEEADIGASEGITIQIPKSYKQKGFDPGKVKAVSAEVVGLVFLPLAFTDSGPMLLGKHLKLNEKLPHRAILCRAYDEFTRKIENQ